MAVFDCFLKIDGIDGESHDDKHKGEIDVASWSWGATQGGTQSSGGGGAGKVAMGDLHVQMTVSKASPKLMLAVASGKHIEKAVLTCRKAGKTQQEYLKITLTDILVSSYQTEVNGSAGIVPTEDVGLNFSKIEFEYREQKPDGSLGGSVKAGWDPQGQPETVSKRGSLLGAGCTFGKRRRKVRLPGAATTRFKSINTGGVTMENKWGGSLHS